MENRASPVGNKYIIQIKYLCAYTAGIDGKRSHFEFSPHNFMHMLLPSLAHAIDIEEIELREDNAQAKSKEIERKSQQKEN